jgi:hypothetical protein
VTKIEATGSPITGGLVTTTVSTGPVELASQPVAAVVPAPAAAAPGAVGRETEEEALALDVTDPLPPPTEAAGAAPAAADGPPLVVRIAAAVRQWLDETPSSLLRVGLAVEIALLAMVLTFRYRRRQRRVKAAARAYAAKQVLTFAPSEDAAEAEAEAEDPIASWVAALADEQARAEARNGGARRASRRPASSTSQG